MNGRFIAFEGGEAAGKSTQVALLARRLGAVMTREPGGTPLGGRVRELFLDPDGGPITPRAEALLMAADRAQHVEALIRPTLASGRHVVTDRYLYSSIAYQAVGRGLDPEEIATLNAWATGGLVPDVVVFLDLSVETARARRAAARPDRMESEAAEFHRRVRDGFRRQADADPGRWVVLDGAAGVDGIAASVWSAVVARCPDLLG